MSRPLEGRTIALAEARQLEELAQLLEGEGATTLRCPMVSILDAPDPDPVRDWLRDLGDDRFGYVVLMTGEALRRLLAFAEREGLRDAVIAALRRTKILTRGPKPGQVLKEIGLSPTRVAQAPTTDGVIATLRGEPLAGQTVGVTLYGEPNPALEQFLASTGAQVRTVLPYVYAPAADEERVADLIARLDRGEVDVLLFTSSPQVDRLYEIAQHRGLQDVSAERADAHAHRRDWPGARRAPAPARGGRLHLPRARLCHEKSRAAHQARPRRLTPPRLAYLSPPSAGTVRLAHGLAAPEERAAPVPAARWRMSLLASSPFRVGSENRLRLSGHRRMAVALLLALWCGVLFFFGLNTGELYQTESLRAILAAELLRDGDWIVPTLYGEPLLTKPPGMYAAIAAASWPPGRVSAATARLPSALAATATVFLFYTAFARRLGRRAGLIAAGLLPASALWLGRVPSAEIDLVQLAWVTAALLCFLRALEISESTEERTFGREWLWWQLALLCVAGGVLTKWTAPAFFYLTVGPLLWWRGRLRMLFRPSHLLSVIVAAAPCIAWAAMVATRMGWDTFLDAVRREALPRLSPAHHSRPYPWHELAAFPAAFLAANLPWSAFALRTLHPGFARLWDERGRRLLQFLHCWTWPNLLFWGLAPGHHLRHAMPLQPGLAGLAALVWVAWLDGRLRWPVPRLRPGRVFLALLVLWLAVKLVFVQAILPSRNPARQPRARANRSPPWCRPAGCCISFASRMRASCSITAGRRGACPDRCPYRRAKRRIASWSSPNIDSGPPPAAPRSSCDCATNRAPFSCW